MVFKKFKTTGVMQVKSDENLSDKESIEKAIEILLPQFEKYQQSYQKYPSDYRMLDEVAAIYNGGEYKDRISDVYSIISSKEE